MAALLVWGKQVGVMRLRLLATSLSASLRVLGRLLSFLGRRRSAVQSDPLLGGDVEETRGAQAPVACPVRAAQSLEDLVLTHGHEGPVTGKTLGQAQDLMGEIAGLGDFSEGALGEPGLAGGDEEPLRPVLKPVTDRLQDDVAVCGPHPLEPGRADRGLIEPECAAQGRQDIRMSRHGDEAAHADEHRIVMPWAERRARDAIKSGQQRGLQGQDRAARVPNVATRAGRQ